MLLRDFALQVEFVDVSGEQSLIGISDKHSLFWALSDLLLTVTFVDESESISFRVPRELTGRGSAWQRLGRSCLAENRRRQRAGHCCVLSAAA